MSYEYDTLKVVLADGVATVSIDNPPINVLDLALLTDLHDFAGDVAEDRDVKVIVFESADPEFFMPHGDMNFTFAPLSELGPELALEQSADLNPMQRVFERFRQLRQVTIGKLSGYARGGGVEFLSALDMRFAGTERGKLAQMEVGIGMIPGGGTAYLPPLIGRARTLEVISGADLFDAATAERYGWINRAVPDGELDAFVSKLARRIARLDFDQIVSGKTAVDAGVVPLLPALIVENRELAKLFSSPAVTTLTRAALDAGAQTRAGERDLEGLLDGLSR